MARASSASRPAGTTWFTSPMRSARCASTGSVLKIISAARAWPMSRGRNQVEPLSGTSPTRPKTWMKLAPSAAMRRSQASASEQPAPAATPLMAPMIGFSSRRMARISGHVALADLGAEVGRIRFATLLQVLPGTERAAGAGQDDGADRRDPPPRP